MDQHQLERMAFNILILGMDLNKEDKISTLAEIAFHAKLDKSVFPHFIEGSLQALEVGYEAWKEIFAQYMISSGNSELIVNINKLF